MKKQKNMNKLLLYIVIICVGIFACSIYLHTQLHFSLSMENQKTRNISKDIQELSQLCTENIDELKISLENAGWNITDNSMSDDGENIIIHYKEGKVTDIWLCDGNGEECQMTLCGLKPGMALGEVLKYLDRDGIVLERHNMQWYATGIELEKEGIQRLEWDADEQVSYFRAIIDAEKADALKDYSLRIEEKEFCYYDEKSDVSVIIEYPEVYFGTNRSAEEMVNKNIERAVQSILQENDVSRLKDVKVDVEYTIKNAESDFFSIVWEGTYQDGKNDKKIIEALTCSILEEGKELNVTETGLSAEEIGSEIAWRMEINEGCYRFYVTPLHIMLIVTNEEGQKADIVPIWR